MNNRISVGLIGAGGFGRMHFDILLHLQREGKVQLAAISDPAIAESTARAAELRRSGVRLYSCYREMLDEEDIEAVTIAAPIHLHFEVAKECIRRGLFVYLEKPAVPTSRQLRQLISLDSHKRVAVGYQLIGSPWSRKIKDWIVKGRLGTLLDIRAAGCWPRDGHYYARTGWAGRMNYQDRPVFDGPATNAFAHLIHNIMYFASTENEEFAQPSEVQGELYRARPIESYDVACMRGRFSTGIRFFTAFTHATREALPFQMEVRGTHGWARVLQDGEKLESSFGSEPCGMEGWGNLMTSYCSFLDFVRGRLARPVTCLHDTLGYSLATCGLLQASGGIHTIKPPHAGLYGNGAEIIYDVSGLRREIMECYADQLLFSERHLPWAIPQASARVIRFSSAAEQPAEEELFTPDATEVGVLRETGV